MPKLKLQEKPRDVDMNEAELPKTHPRLASSHPGPLKKLANDLREPTQRLLTVLEADHAQAYEVVQASSHVFREAEELLRLLRDYSDSLNSVAFFGQLAYRFEEALARLNRLVGGLTASSRASYVDMVHLKRDLKLVWSLVRDVDKSTQPVQAKRTRLSKEA